MAARSLPARAGTTSLASVASRGLVRLVGIAHWRLREAPHRGPAALFNSAQFFRDGRAIFSYMGLLIRQPIGQMLFTPSAPLKTTTRPSPALMLLMLLLCAGLCQPAAGQKSNTPEQRP